MDSSLNAIYGLLFLHLDCVTEAQRTEKQLLSLLMRHTHTHVSTEILNSINLFPHTPEERETSKKRLLDRHREIKEERERLSVSNSEPNAVNTHVSSKY